MGWTCSNGTDASILHKFGQFIHVGQQIILPINARLCAHIVETRKSTDDTFGNEVSLSLLHLLYSLNNNDFEHITVFESLQRNTAPRWHFSVLEKKTLRFFWCLSFTESIGLHICDAKIASEREKSSLIRPVLSQSMWWIQIATMPETWPMHVMCSKSHIITSLVAVRKQACTYSGHARCEYNTNRAPNAYSNRCARCG